MLPIRPQKQKISVTCLVEHSDSILLLRGSQYIDRASYDSIGYFGLPRFTLSFGTNPVDLITKELHEQFGQKIESPPTIIGILERLTDRHTQSVELVYRIRIQKKTTGKTGRYLFARKDELGQYVLPAELKQLRRLLSM